MRTSTAFALLASTAQAFPWVQSEAGVDSALLRRQQSGGSNAGGPDTCPFNPNHVSAVPVKTGQYNDARDGKPGKGVGGFLVPALNDADHQFIAPTSNDIRGPCPGLNAAANHGFLARDGVTTFNELVDAQQNVYNVGYDLAVLLAVLGLSLGDGDIVTNKLSIGCDATTRTSFSPVLTGSQPGLAGHNKFEADTSLTRNDFFTHGGDNFKFNSTLFGMMTDTTGGLYNRENLALYRKQRYDQSRAENPNFYFGPLSLLLFGASSFLYELMPSGPNYTPDVATISSFFGTTQDASSPGGWRFTNNERIPPNWTNRVDPYTIPKVGYEIFAQYAMYPVQFGGNAGGAFIADVNFQNYFKDGKLQVTPDGVSCLLYQMATERLPSSLNGLITPTVKTLNFVLGKLAGIGDNLGCPQPLT